MGSWYVKPVGAAVLAQGELLLAGWLIKTEESKVSVGQGSSR